MITLYYIHTGYDVHTYVYNTWMHDIAYLDTYAKCYVGFIVKFGVKCYLVKCWIHRLAPNYSNILCCGMILFMTSCW